jgi:hypothetical protein
VTAGEAQHQHERKATSSCLLDHHQRNNNHGAQQQVQHKILLQDMTGPNCTQIAVQYSTMALYSPSPAVPLSDACGPVAANQAFVKCAT